MAHRSLIVNDLGICSRGLKGHFVLVRLFWQFYFFSFSLVAILWAQNSCLTQTAHCTSFPNVSCIETTFGSLKMSFYSSIYFDSDKSLSTVHKSRCALWGPFEARQEAEVKWAGQRFIGITLKTVDTVVFKVSFVFLHVKRSTIFWQPVNRSWLFENAQKSS